METFGNLAPAQQGYPLGGQSATAPQKAPSIAGALESGQYLTKQLAEALQRLRRLRVLLSGPEPETDASTIGEAKPPAGGAQALIQTMNYGQMLAQQINSEISRLEVLIG
jgi:hypothetical protein